MIIEAQKLKENQEITNEEFLLMKSIKYYEEELMKKSYDLDENIDTVSTKELLREMQGAEAKPIKMELEKVKNMHEELAISYNESSNEFHGFKSRNFKLRCNGFWGGI